ncbi:hypothetical protein P7L78_26430 [Tistrella bauzanensis]|uniref:hypothetical protein n=1 Tax=Tistrella TaxID=171436 RepID=UPI0031F6B534
MDIPWPTAGGSYLRDPTSGALTRIDAPSVTPATRRSPAPEPLPVAEVPVVTEAAAEPLTSKRPAKAKE